ncbi:MAG: hypothetical protein AAB660_02690 [Patescibacteria group bacterium]
MRILFTLIVFLALIVTPYWIYFPLILIGIVLFPFYLEAILLGLIVDLVYGGGANSNALFGFPFGIVVAILIFFTAPLREYLRFNA